MPVMWYILYAKVQQYWEIKFWRYACLWKYLYGTNANMYVSLILCWNWGWNLWMTPELTPSQNIWAIIVYEPIESSWVFIVSVPKLMRNLTLLVPVWNFVMVTICICVVLALALSLSIILVLTIYFYNRTSWICVYLWRVTRV